MRSILLLFVSGCCFGCSQSGEIAALKASLRTSEETIVAASSATVTKTDEAIVILKENTAALSAIKTKVESLEGSLIETRQTVGTLEASLIKSEPQPLGGDPAALEPPPAKNAKDSQHTSRIVAEPVGARLTSDGTRLRWNVEGNWNPTILETAAHLAEHGIDTNGMTHQQMADIHADIHEGKTSGGAPLTGSIFQNNRAGAITSQRTTFRSVPQRVSFFGRTKYSNRQSCPSGRCPQR